MIKDVDKKEFVANSRTYIGTPFRHRGRTRNGLDCVGLAVRVLMDMDKIVIDKKVYGPEPSKDGLRDYIEQNIGSPVATKEDIDNGFQLELGDILLMKFTLEPHHVAIVSDYIYGGDAMIHAYAAVERVVEHRLDDVWRDRILGVYRFGVSE